MSELLSFVSVIGSVVRLPSSQMIWFADQIRLSVISKFVSRISRIFKKFLKYFNDTVTSTFTGPPLPVLFISLDFYSNDSESVMSSSSGSSLPYFHKMADAFA